MDPVVILANDTVSAGPGGEARLQVRVRNQGRRVESYTVEVVGAPARFAQVEPANISVLPGKEAEVTITFRPPVGASTPTGVLPFAVRAVSEVGSSSSAVAEGTLELAGAAGLQAWADATTASGRWSGSYRLSFSNQGNAPARLFIAAHDPSAAMRLTVRDEVLAVPPGAQVDTEISAKARQPFLRGSAVNRNITASCQDFPFGAERPVPGQPPPRDDPNHRTFQLTFQQKPVVSKIVLALAGLVVVAAAALVLLRLRGNKDEVVALGLARPGAPLDFNAVADGSSTIFLTWRGVPNATGYDIRRTVDGVLTGPVIEQLDASTFRSIVPGLPPGEEACFAVVATGPEGVEDSEPSEPKCARTTAAPTLQPPTNFTASEASPAGTFNVQWDAPADAEGVTYTLFVDSKPSDEGIDGVSTRIALPQGELSYEAELKVKAVKGEETSDASNAQTVVVPALLPVVESTAAGTTVAGGDGGDGGVGGGGGGGGGGGTPTTAAGGGGGGTSTTAPDGTTTTAVTTTVPTPAQEAIEDHDVMSVAWMGPVDPGNAGPRFEAQQRARLEADFAVPAGEILTFTNRDTIAIDAVGPVADVVGAGPDDRFFYVKQTNLAAAEGLCRGQTERCRPMTLQGAAQAAEGGTAVCVIARLPVATTLKVLDETLATKRTELARQIHVLDGATRGQFDDDELVIFASGFRDQPEVAEFCALNGVAPGPVVLEPEP